MAVEIRALPWSLPQAYPLAALPRLPVAAALVCADAFGLAVGLVTIGMGGMGLRGTLVATYAAVALAGLAAGGHYRPRITPSLAPEAVRLVAVLGVPLALVAAVGGRGAEAHALLVSGLAGLGLLLAGRSVCYRAVRSLRSSGRILEPTLIVGAGPIGAEVAGVLRAHPEYGLLPVGFLDDFDDPGLPLPVLGGIRRFEAIISEFSVRRVIIAFGSAREPDMVPLLRACERTAVEIHVVPRFFELGVAPDGADTDHIWGIPLIRLRRAALRPVGWRTKRVFDAVVAGATLALATPLLAAIALLVKLSSPGPVFFRQWRIGQRGRPVKVLKFRTLRENDTSDTQWTVADTTITPIGRLLRRTSLDELPQLMNVVRGDMSLVGPRPERPLFAKRFSESVPGYRDRHRVPVGITGWAQVHGLRGDTSIRERARFDNHYIEHWSLWRDIQILARTVRAILSGGG